MTAILKDLRSLKAARDRGEITPEQYARAEMVLHGMVEDAVLDAEPVAEVANTRSAPRQMAASGVERPAPRSWWSRACRLLLCCLQRSSAA